MSHLKHTRSHARSVAFRALGADETVSRAGAIVRHRRCGGPGRRVVGSRVSSAVGQAALTRQSAERLTVIM
jgi:hypothetical protein